MSRMSSRKSDFPAPGLFFKALMAWGALLVTGCAGHATRPEPDPPPEAMSLAQVRTGLEALPPSCVDAFRVCGEGKYENCPVVIQRSTWSARKRAQWKACEDAFSHWTLRHEALLVELARRDPPPRCLGLTSDDYIDQEISPIAVERDLEFISKGLAKSRACILENCEWAHRNVPEYPMLEEQCAAAASAVQQARLISGTGPRRVAGTMRGVLRH